MPAISFHGTGSPAASTPFSCSVTCTEGTHASRNQAYILVGGRSRGSWLIRAMNSGRNRPYSLDFWAEATWLMGRFPVSRILNGFYFNGGRNLNSRWCFAHLTMYFCARNWNSNQKPKLPLLSESSLFLSHPLQYMPLDESRTVTHCTMARLLAYPGPTWQNGTNSLCSRITPSGAYRCDVNPFAQASLRWPSR